MSKTPLESKILMWYQKIFFYLVGATIDSYKLQTFCKDAQGRWVTFEEAVEKYGNACKS